MSRHSIALARGGTQAPEWRVQRWFNTQLALTLAGLRGRIVVIEAFQMLCPACVSHALPQAARIHEVFEPQDVAVIGLHTVFEHHHVMGAEALNVFLHEYRIRFPVGVASPSANGGAPITMLDYAMEGTPTMVLIDRQGDLRAQCFGSVSDLQLGAAIATLIAELPNRTNR